MYSERGNCKQEQETMEHEYVDDIAAELEIGGDIETLPMAVPPYGVQVSPAVHREDAERLRAYFARQSAASVPG
jgi:hypothetical protein